MPLAVRPRGRRAEGFANKAGEAYQVGIQLTDGRVLSATLCEVERGLFYVTYTTDSAGLGKHLLPRYQVGTCASDAQQRIESRARECGYEAVIWESAPVHPSALSLPEEATRLAN